MANEENMMYDEMQAVKFIRSYMPADVRDKYTDDEILNIIDMIWDYYEDNGFLELPGDDDDPSADLSPELSMIMAYVNKMLAKDRMAAIDTADVRYIVEGELAYEKALGLEE